MLPLKAPPPGAMAGLAIPGELGCGMAAALLKMQSAAGAPAVAVAGALSAVPAPVLPESRALLALIGLNSIPFSLSAVVRLAACSLAAPAGLLVPGAWTVRLGTVQPASVAASTRMVD